MYRPHTFEEIRRVVTPEVAATLDPSLNYGIWWFNRRRTETKQVSEMGSDGRHYRLRMRIRLTVRRGGELEVAGVLGAGNILCENALTSRRETIHKTGRTTSVAGREALEMLVATVTWGLPVGRLPRLRGFDRGGHRPPAARGQRDRDPAARGGQARRQGVPCRGGRGDLVQRRARGWHLPAGAARVEFERSDLPD